MDSFKNYRPQYFLPPERCMDWSERDKISSAPAWCSVDLRDGNQSLVEPMSSEVKTEFFKLLLSLGFKEIEVGFPAASNTEYTFLRNLIENDLIPDDVTVQVLTQSREHIIKRTFEALSGAKNAVVHLYNSTSKAQREQVFKKDKRAIKGIATDGAHLLKELAAKSGGNFRFEYSPESFTGTEPEFALEVINDVISVFNPTPQNKLIVNLPATVENALPHVFAQQVEYIHKNLRNRSAITLSLHTHNDRGCAVAAAELGLLAGGERIEGTLFGNGERTGNADIITLALNLLSHGVDPKLNLSDLPAITKKYTEFTSMPVGARTPYAGELVFAAFSGSHQDAIAKGMALREGKGGVWEVPYLPIDPKDIGREYEADVIRINSQSGKGGVGFVLKNQYGIELPAGMKEQMGYIAKAASDEQKAELKKEDIYRLFEDKFLRPRGKFDIKECAFRQVNGIEATIKIYRPEGESTLKSNGNGRIDAVSNAIKKCFNLNYELSVYEQRALESGSKSKAFSVIGCTLGGKTYFGAGIDEDVIKSGVSALVSAINNLLEENS